MNNCTKRIPDNADFIACGQPAHAFDLCLPHLREEVARLNSEIGTTLDNVLGMFDRVRDLESTIPLSKDPINNNNGE